MKSSQDAQTEGNETSPDTTKASKILQMPDATQSATRQQSVSSQEDSQALADRVRWRELLEEYRQGKINLDSRPMHIEALDLYLQEGGGFLSAPKPLNEEAREASMRRYMRDVMQAYKQAGHALDLDKYTRLASLACDAPVALLNFVDATSQHVKSQYGLPSWQEKEMPRDQSLCNHTILKQDDSVFTVEDASKDWRFQELDIVKGEDHVRWYAGVALRTPEGHNIGAVCVLDTEPRAGPSERQQQALKDIAKMVMLELNPLADQIVRQQQERIFLSSISHELRAPLHGLLASTEMLLEDASADLGPSQNASLQTIANCGTMLQDVIDNVLSQRISHSNRQAEAHDKKSLVDLPAFLEEVLDSTWMGKTIGNEKTATEVEVFVRSNMDKTNVAYRLDRGEIGRIIMNVFGNGIKYTSKGRIEVKLSATEVESSEDGSCMQQRVRLGFQDTGKGIAASYLPQLFTPFVQEDSLSEGYGLGMSMVKELVERNGGKTQVNSVEGQGTTITVELTLEVLPELHPNPFAALHGKHYYASSHVKSSEITYKYVREMCASLGLEESDAADADIMLVKETPQLIVDESMLHDINQPTVLIAMRARPLPVSSGSRVMLVSGPLGPYKLGRAIMAALNVAQPNASTRRFSLSQRGRRPGLARHSSSGPISNLSPKQFALPTLATQSSDGSSLLRTDSDTSNVLAGATASSLDTASSSVGGMSNLSLDSQEPASNQSTDVSSPASSNSTVRPRLGPRTSSLPATEQSRLHCLIIDDNPINLQILRITLERLGLSCVVAENGLEGFRRFAETRQNSASGSLPPRPFDLIFMDVYMPLMNGIESTRKIRLLEAEWRKMRKRMEGARKRATSDLEPASQPASRLRAKPLPEDRCMVVAISGGGQEEEAEMKEAGADFFFQRPFTGKDLKRFLASFEKELSQMRSATRTAGGEVGSSTLKQSVE